MPCYWEGIVDPNDLLKSEYSEIIQDKLALLAEGRTKSPDLDLKYRHRYPVLGIRLNRADRLLFTNIKRDGKQYLLLLDIIFNHKYEKSKAMDATTLTKLMASIEAKEEHNIIPFKETDIDISEEVDIEVEDELHYYNHQYMKLTEVQLGAMYLRPPAHIEGSAGAGKSLLIYQMLVNLINENESIDEEMRLLYVCQSPRLAKHFLDQWKSKFNNTGSISLDILSYEELYKKIYPHHLKPVHFKNFIKWKKAHNKNFPLLKDFTNEIIYNEMKIIASVQKDVYLNHLGVRQRRIHNQETQEQFVQIYERYQAHLSDSEEIDLALTKLPPLEDGKKYHKVFVDEAQDLTQMQLKSLIYELVQDLQIFFFSDTNQGLIEALPGVRDLNALIRERYKRTLLTKYHLTGSHRTPKAICELADKILHIKNAIVKGVTVPGQSCEQPSYVGDNQGHVAYLDKPPQDTSHPLYKLVKHPNTIVITRKEHFEDAQKCFPFAALILTMEQSKGLEAAHIIAYKLFDGKPIIEIARRLKDIDLEKTELKPNCPKDKQSVSLNESLITELNQIFVAITRTKSQLIFIQKTNIHSTKNLIASIFPPVSQQTDSLLLDDELSQEAIQAIWIKLVIDLLENGLQKEAQAIFTRNKLPGSFKDMHAEYFVPNYDDDEDKDDNEHLHVQPKEPASSPKQPQTANQQVPSSSSVRTNSKKQGSKGRNKKQRSNDFSQTNTNSEQSSSSQRLPALPKQNNTTHPKKLCDAFYNALKTTLGGGRLRQIDNFKIAFLNLSQLDERMIQSFLQNTQLKKLSLLDHLKSKTFLKMLTGWFSSQNAPKSNIISKWNKILSLSINLLDMVFDETKQKSFLIQLQQNPNLAKNIDPVYFNPIPPCDNEYPSPIYSALYYLSSNVEEGLEILSILLQNNKDFCQAISAEILFSEVVIEHKYISPVYQLFSSSKGLSVFKLLLQENKKLVQEISAEKLCHNKLCIEGTGENVSLLYLLLSFCEGRDCFKMLLQENKMLAKKISAEGLYRLRNSQAGPEENISPLYLLLSDHVVRDTFATLLQENETLSQEISAEVLCRHRNSQAGPEENISPLYLLLSWPEEKGQTILKSLLEANPKLAQGISVEDLRRQISNHASCDEKLSPLHWLSLSYKGHENFMLLLQNNENLAKNITIEDLCRPNISQKARLKNASMLYYLSGSSKGHQVLKILFQKNKDLLHAIKVENLCLTLTSQAGEFEMTSPLSLMAVLGDCQNVLKTLLQKNESLIQSIRAETLYKLHNTPARNRNESIFFHLTTSSNGQQILKILFQKNKILLQEITADILCCPLTSQAGAEENMSPLYWLSLSSPGLELLMTMIQENDRLAQNITAENLCLACTSQAGNLQNVNPLFLLATQEKGHQFILTLLDKNPNLDKEKLTEFLTQKLTPKISILENYSPLYLLAETASGRSLLKKLLPFTNDMQKDFLKEALHRKVTLFLDSASMTWNLYLIVMLLLREHKDYFTSNNTPLNKILSNTLVETSTNDDLNEIYKKPTEIKGFLLWASQQPQFEDFFHNQEQDIGQHFLESLKKVEKLESISAFEKLLSFPEFRDLLEEYKVQEKLQDNHTGLPHLNGFFHHPQTQNSSDTLKPTELSQKTTP